MTRRELTDPDSNRQFKNAGGLNEYIII
jgi:hypothetical protein